MQRPDTGELVQARNPDHLRQLVDEYAAEHPGEPPPATFSVGEIVEVKGGRFRIVSMGRKFLRLQSLPRGA